MDPDLDPNCYFSIGGGELLILPPYWWMALSLPLSLFWSFTWTFVQNYREGLPLRAKRPTDPRNPIFWLQLIIQWVVVFYYLAESVKSHESGWLQYQVFYTRVVNSGFIASAVLSPWLMVVAAWEDKTDQRIAKHRRRKAEAEAKAKEEAAKSDVSLETSAQDVELGINTAPPAASTEQQDKAESHAALAAESKSIETQEKADRKLGVWVMIIAIIAALFLLPIAVTHVLPMLLMYFWMVVIYIIGAPICLIVIIFAVQVATQILLWIASKVLLLFHKCGILTSFKPEFVDRKMKYSLTKLVPQGQYGKLITKLVALLLFIAVSTLTNYAVSVYSFKPPMPRSEYLGVIRRDYDMRTNSCYFASKIDSAQHWASVFSVGF